MRAGKHLTTPDEITLLWMSSKEALAFRHQTVGMRRGDRHS